MKGSRRVVLAIAGVHGGLVFALIFASMLKGCLPKNEKPKIIAVVSIDPIIVPPVPPPERVKPPDPPKPRPKLKTPEEIRQRNKGRTIIKRPVKPEPVVKPKPLLQKEDLEDLIDPQPPTPVDPPPQTPQAMSALQEVLVDLQRKAYVAWEKPDGLASSRGKTASVQFRVHRFGRVMKYELVKSSGLTLMDQSVVRAAQAIKSVKRLPSAYKGEHYDFTIEFELTD
jgi:TonB family protein